MVYQVRNYSSDFQETKWISLAVFSQGQLFLIIVPLFLSITPSATTVFFVSICLTLCVFTLALVVMIFVPKIIRLHFGEEEVKTASKQEERLNRRMTSSAFGPTTASALQKRLASTRYSSDMRSTTTDASALSGKMSFKLPTHREDEGLGSSRSMPESTIPITSSRLRLQSLRFRRNAAKVSVGTQTDRDVDLCSDTTMHDRSFESLRSKSSEAEKDDHITSETTSASLGTSSQNPGNSDSEVITADKLPLSRT